MVLNTGAVDIGQGSDTVLTQICAEALKLPLDRVSLASPDTDGSPYNWGTTASRVTYTTGRAVRRRRRRKSSARSRRMRPRSSNARRGSGAAARRTRVASPACPTTELPFVAVSARAHWRKGGPIIGSHFLGVRPADLRSRSARSAMGLPFPQIGVYSFGALVVEVEVDEATGKVDVLRAWSAVDVGARHQPPCVEGQIEGAFVQGLGFALTEEMVWDGPRLANPTLMDYKVPTTIDAPYEIQSDHRRASASRTARSAPRAWARSASTPSPPRSRMP